MAGENAIVGDVGLRVNAVDPGLERQIQALINKIETNATFQVTANTQQAQQNVNNLVQGTNELASNWANAALQVAGFTAAINIARGSVERLIGSFAGIFDQITQARAGFTSILGSEGAGTGLLNDIREFARESPFAADELIMYSQQLLGVGKAAESIVPLLQSLGDYVASVGGDTQNLSRVLFTLTQIQSIGRLTGQDAIQLQSALIPVTKLLANYLDITTQEVKKLQEQGKITADQVFAALTAAGTKVEGAMNEATKTISGARSNLEDTIQIILQDAPALQAVYADIVQGILGLTQALESPEVNAAINRFFEGIGKVYEALKPVIEQLSESGGRSVIFGIRAFAGVLESLAVVLNAIPEQALSLLTQFFVTLAAIKAPLALIQYVNRIQEVATGLVGFATNSTRTAIAQTQLTTATTAATAATKAQLAAINENIAAMGRQEGRIATMITRYQALVGAAAAYAGMRLQQSDSAGGQGVGGVLAGAGIGFAVGGPAGAVVGGVIGSVTTILNASADAARKEAENLKRRAVEVASEFFTAFESEFQSLADEGAGKALVDEVAGAANVVKTYTDLLPNLNKELEELKEKKRENNGEGLFTREDAERLRYLNDFVPRVGDQIERYNAELTAITEDPRFAKWALGIETRLGLLNRDGIGELVKNLGEAGRNPIFRTLIMGERGFDPKTIQADYQVLTDTLGRVGITIDELINLPYEELITKLTVKIPEAITEAQKAFDAFTAAAKRASEVTNINFGPLISQFETVQETLNSQQSVSDAFARLFTVDANGAVTNVEATLQNVAAVGKAVVADAKVQAQRVWESTIAAGGDEAAAFAAQTARFNDVIASNFDALRDALQLTDADFNELLITAGLWDIYVKSSESSGAAENFLEYAETIGIAAEELAKLIGLQGEITPEMQITVTADVTDAIVELQRIQSVLAEGVGDGGVEAELLRRQAELQRIVDEGTVGAVGSGLTEAQRLAIAQTETDRIQSALFELGRTSSDDYIAYLQTRLDMETELSNEWLNIQREITQIQTDIENDRLRKEEQARREAEKLQREREQAEREAERAAEQWANAIESATNTLENTIETAAKEIAAAAQAWVGSIKERTQYEQAVSATRLTSNVTRQVNDLTEITAGLAALRARGVTDEVLNALGIDNVSDVRQVRRLVNTSDADLAELTRAVGERDRLALSLAKSEEDTRQRTNITAGIIAAAKALDLDLTKAQAAGITAQFDITAGTDAESVALQILNILTAGSISR